MFAMLLMRLFIGRISLLINQNRSSPSHNRYSGKGSIRFLKAPLQIQLSKLCAFVVSRETVPVVKLLHNDGSYVTVQGNQVTFFYGN
jgi:hypothetical protein